MEEQEHFNSSDAYRQNQLKGHYTGKKVSFAVPTLGWVMIGTISVLLMGFSLLYGMMLLPISKELAYKMTTIIFPI